MEFRNRRMSLRWVLCISIAIVAAASAFSLLGAEDRGWIDVDYSRLVDRRILAHNGEAVGSIVERLAAAPDTMNPADLALVDPLLERYAFVLPDAIEALAGAPQLPMVELGWLWEPGEAGPAWVELLRSRRFLVESDGQGRLRVFLPVPQKRGPLPISQRDSEEAAHSAWDAAWPVLRHVLAAERARLASLRGGETALQVSAYPYRHDPAHGRFSLGVVAHRVDVSDTRPRGDRPPLDLAAWTRFLAETRRLQGGLLAGDELQLLGSEVDPAPALLGEDLTLADLAVAYRAVFHGSLAEPYMSLDKGPSPQRSIVNYGGRLRDTKLGLVSLLCDIRFKTFSQGIDPLTMRDIRTELRQVVPDFKSHLERFSLDASARGLMSQQTRLWFYPDSVEAILSPQADVLVMRRARMTAASERVGSNISNDSEAKDPAWTRGLVSEINRDYEALGRVFPELESLDETVRLLTFFSWLKMLDDQGAAIPDLAALLTVPLPALRTPRSFPQLLAFNALPGVGSRHDAQVFPRPDVVSALDRLSPEDGSWLPAKLRFARALSVLDNRAPHEKALAERLAGLASGGSSDEQLDALTYQAERQRMHDFVLKTLAPEPRNALVQRQKSGETLRVFSVGIGGLDLGMKKVLARAGGRQLKLPWGTDGAMTQARGAGARSSAGTRPGRQGWVRRPASPRDEWRHDPAGLARTMIPEHGFSSSQATRAEARGPYEASRQLGDQLLNMAGDRDGGWAQVVLGLDSPDLRSRRVSFDTQGDVTEIERIEGAWRRRFRPLRSAASVVMEPVELAPAGDDPGGNPKLPEGLGLLRFAPLTSANDRPGGSLGLALRVGTRPESLTAIPALVLDRLLLGHAADGGRATALPGIREIPSKLSGVRHLMILDRSGAINPPWEASAHAIDPLREARSIAHALDAWWDGSQERLPRIAVVVGTNPQDSPSRWADAATPLKSAFLLLPEEGDDDTQSGIIGALRNARGSIESGSKLPKKAPRLVILASTQAPGRVAHVARALSKDSRMKGKFLAIWSLSGHLRPDLPGSLLETGILAGVGLASREPLEHAELPGVFVALRESLERGDPLRHPEDLDGPFTWFY